ncbi:1-acyl-sn-glycerol-3-phosphate acyltransferase [Georgenia subflava]|uniref:1-acyl-sn-glycerol-3-phosphate acyltransferase n=1 Tax=Georgenia subflava TaxID=1622177 RepID=A0A6N7EGS0_9MICO|nr:1-acyl-sn-glycerol-3-phosphate acyltransferase [Georgenia subflava]MPV37240.1 1-acyl-sn-glycerol-3-phosphate acyltransferase [Georgenia subflava]
MRLPPRWVRRTVIAPAVVLSAFTLITTLPVWLIVATALTALIPGYLRLPRVLWMVTFYLVWNSAALVCLFVLWVASGLGWKVRSPAFQRAHYVLTGWFLHLLFLQARWVLRLQIDVEGDVAGASLTGRPVVVASRHAGPGDSLILIHALTNWFDREPRIVLKDTLQWDPAVDVMLNRLPNRFIAPAPFGGDRPGRATSLTEQVGNLAVGLDANDAFVIFPEGGNFSPERRRRRIDGLRREGRAAMAARAEAMRHVMAPRPGGILAALDAAPDAGVVFLAHTGLDRMITVRDIWRELPMDKRIVMHGWHVQPAEIPAGREDRIDWLYGWWERVDGWIGARATPQDA